MIVFAVFLFVVGWINDGYEILLQVTLVTHTQIQADNFVVKIQNTNNVTVTYLITIISIHILIFARTARVDRVTRAENPHFFSTKEKFFESVFV